MGEDAGVPVRIEGASPEQERILRELVAAFPDPRIEALRLGPAGE
jgi:hypothetical protein